MNSDGDIERRYAPLEVEGRTLRGTGIRYGDVARMPFGRETFEPGAFGDVSALDVRLNVHHVRSRLIARTPETLTLTDSPEALRLVANLPETREADDTLTLVRHGILRGLSVEFRALAAPFMDGLRRVQRAVLLGFGVVDSPAYPDSTVEARAEVRQDGEGIELTFHYDRDLIISDRAEMRQRSTRKSRVRPGAFDFAIEDETREIQALIGRQYDQPIGSRLAGTLEIENSAEALTFRVAQLPDTGYVRDFRAQQATGAATFGVSPLYRIPPPETVPNAVTIVPEPDNPGVAIQVVNQAVLTALAIVPRPPRGNPGAVQTRRRRVWL